MTRQSPSGRLPLRVSVVVPAYNSEATIERAIESVLEQTYAAWEIIVVDDGSSRALAPQLARFGDRVRVVRQENGGASKARNRGIDLSCGDLVAFLDSDDLWEPTKLEKSVSVFQSHDDVQLVATRYKVQDQTTGTVKTAGPSPANCDVHIPPSRNRAFDLARQVSTPTIVIRRQVLSQDRFDTSLATAEDRDLWIRILRNNACYFLSEPLATVIVQEDSLSNTNLDLDSLCMLEVIRRYSDEIGYAKSNRERAYVHYKWATGHGSGGSAWRHLLYSLRFWPLPFSAARTPCRCARLRFAIGLCLRSSLARHLLPA